MAEGVVKQVTEVPATVIGTVRHKPILAIGVAAMVMLIVLLIEAYKPGIFTNPIKKFLTSVGVKGA